MWSLSWLGVAALLAVALAGCAREEPCGRAQAFVRRVIDGDTVELEDGTKVRYLMVDAPEITRGHDDCYGAEARDFNRSLVEGRQISLKYDEVCTDRFDRLLAYVFIDGLEVNSALVERGYACVLHIPPNGNDRAAEFEGLEQRAKLQERGFWTQCEARPCP